jgi:hypothetical protein
MPETKRLSATRTHDLPEQVSRAGSGAPRAATRLPAPQVTP